MFDQSPVRNDTPDPFEMTPSFADSAVIPPALQRRTRDGLHDARYDCNTTVERHRVPAVGSRRGARKVEK